MHCKYFTQSFLFLVNLWPEVYQRLVIPFVIFMTLWRLTYFWKANNLHHFEHRIRLLAQSGSKVPLFYHMKTQCKHQTCKTWKKLGVSVEPDIGPIVATAVFKAFSSPEARLAKPVSSVELKLYNAICLNYIKNGQVKLKLTYWVLFVHF